MSTNQHIPNNITLTIEPLPHGFYRHLYRNTQGQLHRLNGPAERYYNKNRIISEGYYQNGQHHRLGGPAAIAYDSKRGTRKWYYQNNRLHRLDGPAVVDHENGQITWETYYQNGQHHRLDGPATIEYQNGQIIFEAYYQNGQPCSDEQIAIIKFAAFYEQIIPTIKSLLPQPIYEEIAASVGL